MQLQHLPALIFTVDAKVLRPLMDLMLLMQSKRK